MTGRQIVMRSPGVVVRQRDFLLRVACTWNWRKAEFRTLMPKVPSFLLEVNVMLGNLNQIGLLHPVPAVSLVRRRANHQRWTIQAPQE
jgi:hypothetical protein